MTIAVTGATGFIGRYLVRQLSEQGLNVKALRRESSNISGLPENIQWIVGDLNDHETINDLLSGADKVVHAAVYRPGGRFQDNDINLDDYLEANFMGSVRIFEEAKKKQVSKLVFLSSCAVHDVVLLDRPLDENHPLQAKSHYGAYKAAVEKFIHSYGLGLSLPFCALRPTGVYGLREDDPTKSKWYQLIQDISLSKNVICRGGGKEVNVMDVVRAILLLLDAENISGQVYNCYDQYISQYDVAHLAKELCGSKSVIDGEQARPKHQIETNKIKSLGMKFGGDMVLKQTVECLLEHTDIKTE